MTPYLIQSHQKNLILHSKLWLCIWYRVILLHIVHCCGSDSDFCLCDCQARPGPTLKCDQCRSSFINDSDLKIHIEATHKMSLSSPATGMHLYKTMFYTKAAQCAVSQGPGRGWGSQVPHGSPRPIFQKWGGGKRGKLHKRGRNRREKERKKRQC